MIPGHLLGDLSFRGYVIGRVPLFSLAEHSYGFHHDSAFEAFFLQFAGDLMSLANIALILVVISVTAAAAIELSPAFAAIGFGVNVSLSEIGFHFLIESALIDIAHFILIDTDELVTGENIAVGSDSDVVVAAAAAAQALDSARTLIEVEHEVEEVELIAFFLVIEDLLGEFFVLSEDFREVLVSESVLIAFAYDRLNGDLVESGIAEGENVFGEVLVLIGEGTADVVLLIASSGNQLLVLGENNIVAALTVSEDAEVVVDLLATVDGEDDVGHFAVDEIDFFVVQQQAVGSYSEAEFFIILSLTGACVLHDLLDNAEIHKWLTAEEVQFQVRSVAGVFQQEVDSVFTGLIGHEFSALTEVACRSEAVLASELTVVSDIEAHSLYWGSNGVLCVLFVIVHGEENFIVI